MLMTPVAFVVTGVKIKTKKQEEIMPVTPQKPAIRTDIDDWDNPDFTVFTESDLSPDGMKIASTVPLWYNSAYREELEATISRMEYALREKFVPEGRRAEFTAKLKTYKDRLQSLNDAVPKFNKKTIDMVAKVVSTLAEKITNALFPKDQMERGIVDPSEESRRMTQPLIPLNDAELKWAMACNITPVKGKVSRTQAELMWKIGRKILGEPTNVEILRN